MSEATSCDQTNRKREAESDTATFPPRRAAADLRTLRILQVLTEYTDDRTGLSTTQIREALKHPENPQLPAIEVDRGSIRQSIKTLRAAGFSISSGVRTGYSLQSRPLDESSIELIVGALRCSRTLSAAQRNRCMNQVIRLAPATQRARLLNELTSAYSPMTPAPTQRAAQHTVSTHRYRLEAVEAIARRGICDGLPISFELADAARAPMATCPDAHVAPKRFGTRRHITPERCFEHAGASYLSGRIESAHRTALPAERAFRLDRLANLTCIDDDRVYHVALDRHPDRKKCDGHAMRCDTQNSG